MTSLTRAVVTEPMRMGVDQRRFEFPGIGVTELGFGQFLQVIVQKPRVIDRSLEDESLATRYRGAMAAMQRTSEKMWAGRSVAFGAAEDGTQLAVAGFATGAAASVLPSTAFPGAPFPRAAFPGTAARQDLRRHKQPPQPDRKILPVIAAPRFIGDGCGHLAEPRLERRTPFRRGEWTGLDLACPQHVGQRTCRRKHVLNRLAAAGSYQIVRILPVRERRQFEALAGFDQRQREIERAIGGAAAGIVTVEAQD